MNSPTRQSLLLSLALSAGLGISLLQPTAGCILPDYCILVGIPGADYCVEVIGAQMWPIGQPEIAEELFIDGFSPRGCLCMNATQGQQLLDQVPQDQYLALLGDIQQRAMDVCASGVPQGFNHNCYDPMQISFTGIVVDDTEGKSGTCIDSCAYTNPPPFGSCPDDPDPFECNDVFGDSGGGSEDEVGKTDTMDGTMGEEEDSGTDAPGGINAGPSQLQR